MAAVDHNEEQTMNKRIEHFEPRRTAGGGLDYDYYRAGAERERRAAISGWVRAIARVWRRWRRAPAYYFSGANPKPCG